MESGNSGSMQSSSGGDEEYDSRAESISIFLNSNNNPLTHLGPVNNAPPQLAPSNHHLHQQQQSLQPGSSILFDPLPNYFTNPNSLLISNLDNMVNWSRNLRSDPNPPDLAGIIRPTFPSLQIPPGQASGSGSGSGSASGNIDQNNNTGGGVKNPKKRSRASRRAPTTVLTTDTTNFRAMVQEFTGIPAPPFSSSSFPRSRLDLFGNSANFRSHFDSPSPPYLLRPFAHKIQPNNATVSSSSSSMADAIVSTTANNSDQLGFLNPVLNFHPLFQPPPPKFQAVSARDPPLKIGGFEEFGLSHGGPVNANPAVLRGDEEGVLRPINDGGQSNSVAARTSEGMMEPWICSSD